MRLYDAARTARLVQDAMREGVDWSELGPELAFQLQEAQREIDNWMLEASHASQIADHWKRRFDTLRRMFSDDFREPF